MKTKNVLLTIASALARVAIAFYLTLTASQALAWGGSGINKPLPANPADLDGAFSGEQYINGKSNPVDVFIHGEPMTGSFIVTLVRDSQKAQIFYAEILEKQEIGLIVLGLTNPSEVKPVKSGNDVLPAALMKVSVDNKNVIQTIDISPQDGVRFLDGAVHLTSLSKNYGISNTLSQGEYVGRNRSDDLKVYAQGNDILVSGAIAALGISNDYSLNFDLTGVGAIRAQGRAEFFQKKEKPEISALVLPVTVDGRAGIIVVKASSDGSAAQAVIMKVK
jgi:hypothetical protein